ncbi:SAP-like protein BP-73 [Andrographis paniculata]|uniref:SAP-like protein BP-73 n=1 Tax=Andrographis paniculata TaxID=175694 RepID=UPI0021E73AC2|nr:SAP-like protein BP-73 [Andrographis paniculata]
MNMVVGGGGSVLCPRSVLHFHLPSSRLKFGNPKPFFPPKEIADWPSFASIRAEGNGKWRKNNPSARAPEAEELEEGPPLDDRRSSLSPNKEKIIALFKRIQASISKDDTLYSKNQGLKKFDDEKSSAEAILGVLHQSRTQGKGRRNSVKKVSKSPHARKESQGEDERAVHSPTLSFKSTRPPSNFIRKSPTATLLSRREKSEPEDEALHAMSAPSIPGEEFLQTPQALPATDNSNEHELVEEFKNMNLARLKEIAKSKGLRGYSKLKKSELIDLLTQSVNSNTP